MRKLLKPLALSLLLALTAAPAIMSSAESVTVYITRTGEKYHNDGCRSLRKSKIPISREDAKSRGYGPCGICAPPE